MLKLQILGPVSVSNGGVSSSFRSAMVRALMLRLALAAGQRVSRLRLVEALWDRPPLSAEANLRLYASMLRRELSRLCPGAESALRAHRGLEGGYTLELPEDDIDLYRFRALCRGARTAWRRGEVAIAEAELYQALSLWKGRVGEGVPGSRELTYATESIALERTEAAEDWLFARLALGDGASIIADARVLAGEDPLRERATEALIRACRGAGDVSGALQGFERHSQALAVELGIEPSARLSALYQDMLSSRRTSAASAGASTSSVASASASRSLAVSGLS